MELSKTTIYLRFISEDQRQNNKKQIAMIVKDLFYGYTITSNSLIL